MSGKDLPSTEYLIQRLVAQAYLADPAPFQDAFRSDLANGNTLSNDDPAISDLDPVKLANYAFVDPGLVSFPLQQDASGSQHPIEPIGTSSNPVDVDDNNHINALEKYGPGIQFRNVVRSATRLFKR